MFRLQYLKTVPHISVLNFFTFWWSPQLAQVRMLVFSRTCPLLSPFTQNTVLSSPQTHTRTECKRNVCGFFFSFSFSIILPPYSEDPLPANSQLVSSFSFFVLWAMVDFVCSSSSTPKEHLNPQIYLKPISIKPFSLCLLCQSYPLLCPNPTGLSFPFQL